MSPSRWTPDDPTESLAASFHHPGVATAYAYRPPYPAEVFDILDTLIVGTPRVVLDIGAGDGALARPLAERVDWVDAVEVSEAMIEAGRRRPGGRRPNLVWLHDTAENMPAGGSYGLVTAGASLHWMSWEVALDRIARALAPGAVLAIVDQRYHRLDWHDNLVDVIVRYSRNPAYDPDFSLPDELERRGLLDIRGRRETAPTRLVQPIREYVEQFHSTASLARELMSPHEAARFDREVESLVRGYEADDGTLSMQITASIIWGRLRTAGT